jgi:hypothetical protein
MDCGPAQGGPGAARARDIRQVGCGTASCTGSRRSGRTAFKILDEHVETTRGEVSISTMHLAKGLEFRAVVVMACDDEIIPLQERIETVGDDADLQEVYDTERQLLYVACTRARDFLLLTGGQPVSEFLDDLATSQKAIAFKPDKLGGGSLSAPRMRYLFEILQKWKSRPTSGRLFGACIRNLVFGDDHQSTGSGFFRVTRT